MEGTMAGIQQQEKFIRILHSVSSAVDTAISSIVEMQNAMGASMDLSALQGARIQIASASDALDEMNEAIQDSADTAKKEIPIISSLMDSVKESIKKNISFEKVKDALNLSDELTQTTAKLGVMGQAFGNAGMSGQELMNAVYLSAQNARGSLSDMASVVTEFGNTAGNAFGSPQEIVDFANLVQKQTVMAGASPEESVDIQMQLSQALGFGTLGEDALSSILKQAPNLIQNIADYMGEPIGKLQEMASAGQLSAGVIKEAIFSASDEINAKFAEMPVTWDQMWQSFQDSSMMAFQPVLQKLSELANNPEFQNFVDQAIGAMTLLADTVTVIFDIMGTVAGFVMDNWSVIGPIVYGVIAALAIYYVWMGLLKTATMAFTIVQGICNAALGMDPVMRIVVGVILLVAVIYAVCSAIAKVTGAAGSGLGIICGAAAVAGAILLNIAIGVIDAIIQAVWAFIEPFLGIIEWILNVVNGGFDDLGGAVANLIGQIISWFLSLGKIVTKIIDAICGTDWTGGLNDLQNSVIKWGKNENAITFDREALEMDNRIDYGDAFKAGADWGDSAADRFGKLFDSKDQKENYTTQNYGNTGGFEDVEDAGAGAGMGGDAARTAANTGQTAANTAAIANSLDVSNEQLKYLRDVAERDTVNRFTTASIKVEMTNNNSISSKMDLDGIVNSLAEAVGNAMFQTAEGVHI